MKKDDISTYAKSDGYFVGVIGEFVRSNRITQNRTQEDLAEAAGINRSTLVQLEKGKPVNLLSLIQILRALRKLDILRELEVKPQISPLRYASMQIRTRRRASRKEGNTIVSKAEPLGDGLKVSKKPKSDW